MSVQSDESLQNTSNGQPDGAVQPEAAAEASAAAAPNDLETLRAEIAEIEQKADEYLRLAQRTQADFINYRRRVDDERAQQAREATTGLLQRLLPVLDDFQRAIENAAPTELESGWGQGVQLVERNLRGVLASEGVERIEADGAEFDPRLHEALGTQPSSEAPEGHVLVVVRQGYRKGDRVLRPAQVIIARRPD